MSKIRLTQAAVDRLNPPDQGRVEVWDTVLPGFGLRVASSGRKTWQCFYRVHGRLVRETIGTLAQIPRVDQARALARASIAKAHQGVDPVADRRAVERDTLGAVLDRYMARKAGDAAYLAETRRTFEVDVKPALGSKPISEVSRRDVRELLETIVERGSPGHANHVLSYLRAALSWCLEQEIISANPAAGIKKPSPASERDRALSDNEIRAFWLACDRLPGAFGPFLKMLLLTGQRRGELAGATWSEFDLNRALWSLPSERTKNGRSHDVHLAPQALVILGGLQRHGDLAFTATGRVLAGFEGARLRLMRLIQSIAGEPVPHFTIHDLRRTTASGMARIGIAPHVIDKVLNHSTGKISGVARVYNRHEYESERRIALEQWAQHVEGLLTPRDSNVTAFRRP